MKKERNKKKLLKQSQTCTVDFDLLLSAELIGELGSHASVHGGISRSVGMSSESQCIQTVHRRPVDAGVDV